MSRKLTLLQREKIQKDLDKFTPQDRINFLIDNVEILSNGNLGPDTKFINRKGGPYKNLNFSYGKIAAIVSLKPILGNRKTQELLSYQTDPDGFVGSLVKLEAPNELAYADFTEKIFPELKQKYDIYNKLTYFDDLTPLKLSIYTYSFTEVVHQGSKEDMQKVMDHMQNMTGHDPMEIVNQPIDEKNKIEDLVNNPLEKIKKNYENEKIVKDMIKKGEYNESDAKKNEDIVRNMFESSGSESEIKPSIPEMSTTKTKTKFEKIKKIYEEVPSSETVIGTIKSGNNVGKAIVKVLSKTATEEDINTIIDAASSVEKNGPGAYEHAKTIKSDVEDVAADFGVSASDVASGIGSAASSAGSAVSNAGSAVKTMFSGSGKEETMQDATNKTTENPEISGAVDELEKVTTTMAGHVASISDTTLDENITAGISEKIGELPQLQPVIIDDGTNSAEAYQFSTDSSSSYPDTLGVEDTSETRGIKEGPYPNPVHPDALSIFFGSATNPEWVQGLFSSRDNWDIEAKKQFMYNQTLNLFKMYGPDMLITELVFGIHSPALDIKRENEEIIQLHLRSKGIKVSIDTTPLQVSFESANSTKIEGDKLNPFREVEPTIEDKPNTETYVKLSGGNPEFVKSQNKVYPGQILIDLSKSLTKGQIRATNKKQELERAMGTVQSKATKIRMAGNEEMHNDLYGVKTFEINNM